MRHIAWITLLAAFLSPVQAQKSLEANRIMTHIKYLASDSLRGRDSGSPGELKAARYIAAHFKKLGLKGLGKGGSFFQPFSIGKLETRNVVAYLPGNKPGQHIIIGGHFDHVGMGHFGSTWNERGKNRIHNGADDNASGTSVVLELARAYVRERSRLDRGILFILFSGEERGLLGSKHYADNPLLPLTQCAAMINLDMVGRGKTGKFTASGTGTSPGFHRLIQQVNAKHKYRINSMPFGFAPSDNTSFYTKRIPVLFFSTGTHADYHNPGDDWEKINKQNALCIARFTFEVASRLCNAKGRPRHRWAELHPPSLLRGIRSGIQLLIEQRRNEQPSTDDANRPRLGILGEQNRQPRGVRVTRVSPRSAAARAGLKVGDVITRLGDRQIEGFEDLSAALRKCTRGTEAALTYSRAGRNTTLQIFGQGSPSKAPRKQGRRQGVR